MPHSVSERPHATAAVTGRILDFNHSSVTTETANAKLLVHGQLSCERPYDCSSLGRMVEGHPDVRVRHVVRVRECDRVIVVRASLEHGPPLGRNALACAEEDSQSTAHGAPTQQRRPATVGCAGDGGAARCMSPCRQTGARLRRVMRKSGVAWRGVAWRGVAWRGVLFVRSCMSACVWRRGAPVGASASLIAYPR